VRHKSAIACLVMLAAAAAGVTAAAVPAAPGASTAPSAEEVAVQLRDAAMAGHDVAFSWVSELTSRFGPRPAGSANEHAAAEWAAARLKALGFENVHIETFPITAWVRGPEHAEIVAPSVQATS
jgi:hypothetical protein